MVGEGRVEFFSGMGFSCFFLVIFGFGLFVCEVPRGVFFSCRCPYPARFAGWRWHVAGRWALRLMEGERRHAHTWTFVSIDASVAAGEGAGRGCSSSWRLEKKEKKSGEGKKNKKTEGSSSAPPPLMSMRPMYGGW